MKFNQSLSLAVFTGLVAGLSSASAHIGIGGDRTLNGGAPIDGLGLSPVISRTVSSSFGWADATDASWGDSHRLVAFKFTLASTQTVDISVFRFNNGGQSGAFDTLLPAFSLFQATAFVGSTHDGANATKAYLAATYGPGPGGETFTNTNGDVGYEAGDVFADTNSNAVWDAGEQFTDTDGDGTWEFGDAFTDANGNGVQDGPGLNNSGKEGAFSALTPWKIHTDGGTEWSLHTIVGHKADGTPANYGAAAGINGDGAADGFVTAKFADLAAGEYFLFVGGANYAAQNSADVLSPGTSYRTYGIGVAVAAPEPTSAALLALSAASLGLVRRRQS